MISSRLQSERGTVSTMRGQARTAFERLTLAFLPSWLKREMYGCSQRYSRIFLIGGSTPSTPELWTRSAKALVKA